jgi:hypothetical protein
MGLDDIVKELFPYAYGTLCHIVNGLAISSLATKYLSEEQKEFSKNDRGLGKIIKKTIESFRNNPRRGLALSCSMLPDIFDYSTHTLAYFYGKFTGNEMGPFVKLTEEKLKQIGFSDFFSKTLPHRSYFFHSAFIMPTIALLLGVYVGYKNTKSFKKGLDLGVESALQTGSHLALDLVQAGYMYLYPFFNKIELQVEIPKFKKYFIQPAYILTVLGLTVAAMHIYSKFIKKPLFNFFREKVNRFLYKI